MANLFSMKHFNKLLKYNGLSKKYYRSAYSSVAGDKQQHYDLVVIGGGSGGLSCAKQAGLLGKRVAVLDYVTPTPHGGSWSLGGTCVNVGCIPKKLMHHASLLGGSLEDAKHYGWNVPEAITHDWNTLVSGVQGFIRSINWGYRVQLKSKKVDYHNALGYLLDRNTVRATYGNGKIQTISSDNIVLCTGMRPTYLDIPGAKEYCITSDDIFSLKKPPGKTLCVGASYVSLECAGFLTGLGFDTTVMMRSIPLRGFDRQCSDLVLEAMKAEGTSVIYNSVPQKVEKLEDGKLKVTFQDQETGTVSDEVYDTVMLSIGRTPATKELGVENAGVKLHEKTLKVVGKNGGEFERSTIPNIYAIGDILQDAPELTPVAMLAGRMLAQRMFKLHSKPMDYKNVATTVFTPLEYSTVGLSEEAAVEEYGEDNLEVYHAFYRPLQFTVSKNNVDQCYVKVIAEREGAQKILGLHFLGPHAGEVMQGFAVAFRIGMTYPDLMYTVGIHPTSAEEIANVNITKRSGLDPVVTSC